MLCHCVSSTSRSTSDSFARLFEVVLIVPVADAVAQQQSAVMIAAAVLFAATRGRGAAILFS
jgi:hypothetical protein